jgi:hypothetical protein
MANYSGVLTMAFAGVLRSVLGEDLRTPAFEMGSLLLGMVTLYLGSSGYGGRGVSHVCPSLVSEVVS